MSLLHPKPVLASQLTWIPEQKLFVTEMSDLGGFGQVYDDACDEGLTLVSRYSDRDDIVFVVNHTEIDADRDVRWWDLVPAGPTGPARLVNFKVRVYND